jgi:hypothetical protein
MLHSSTEALPSRSASMPLQIRCIACRKKLNVRDQFIGKKIKCPVCRHTFAVDGPASAAPIVTNGVHPFSAKRNGHKASASPPTTAALWLPPVVPEVGQRLAAVARRSQIAPSPTIARANPIAYPALDELPGAPARLRPSRLLWLGIAAMVSFLLVAVSSYVVLFARTAPC